MQVKGYLKLCGYSELLLCADYRFGSDRTVPLAAFAHEPKDARSACIATIQATRRDARPQVIECRELGTPVVIALRPGAVEFWKQGQRDAELVEHVVPGKAETYFKAHAPELAPEAVFRAKTWGRLDHQFQLDFVDAGLMPLVEKEIGQRLTNLIERVVHGLRRSLWPKKADVSLNDGLWLIKAAFWLLAARILCDKRVPGFINLNLHEVQDVFGRVARHYDSAQAGSRGIVIGTRSRRQALESAADEIAQFSHLGHVTTESLAQVYESALITKETRARLGTHSTPQHLVDYIVWKLAKWIEEIPEKERDVFEPACGHAAFLVAAVRLLKEFLSADRQTERKEYLRKHLHGIEIDSFALEIGRLSLTLADIPNPNGWDLACADVYEEPHVVRKARRATIILGNPPFENFSGQDRQRYRAKGVQLTHTNKTVELLARVLPHLRVGGVFGFLVPQGILHSSNAAGFRRMLCDNFELQEICLLPDGVFSFSDAESAILLGRRVTSPSARHLISYRRVREADRDRFRQDYIVSSRHDLSQLQLCGADDCVLRLPDLLDLWEWLAPSSRLADYADLGQGLFYKGQARLEPGQRTFQKSRFRGAVRGFAGIDPGLNLHELPPAVWMSLERDAVDRPVTGATTGISQVLLNYAPVSRGPWRLKAVIDREGHAVTSRFITVRRKSKTMPLEYLWALLNSPLANAYVYAHSMKRDVLVGLMREMPVPGASREEMQLVASAASDYLKTLIATDGLGGKRAPQLSRRQRLLRMDAEVLRLYDLSPRLERQLLDLFRGHQRPGVPFQFNRYFPDDFEPWLHLYEYLSEGYRNASAAAMLESHRTFDVPEVSQALQRATEDFEA